MNIYEIDREILQASHDCEHDFACLFGERAYCVIDRYVTGNGEVISIRQPNTEYYCYVVPFGLSYRICSCPTRADIYKKYGGDFT